MTFSRFAGEKNDLTWKAASVVQNKPAGLWSPGCQRTALNQRRHLDFGPPFGHDFIMSKT